MSRLGRIASVAAAVVGCSTLRSPPSPDGIDVSRDERHLSIPLMVRNDNLQDVIVYVLHGGQRSRIGIATAAAATPLAFPAHFATSAGPVQFFAVPLIGGRTGFRKSVRSDPLMIRLDDRIVWTLESDLSRSTIGVYASVVDGQPDTTPPR